MANVVSPKKALERLVQGNKRFTSDKLKHPNRTGMRREAIKTTQKPFAIVLGCSDSRVAPEIIFDQGLGDLFIIRVAGNVIDTVGIDSIEFAANHLGASIVLVLGHENCGAVSAVVANQASDIPTIARLIEPAVEKTRNLKGNRIVNAITANINQVVEQIQRTSVLIKLIEQKKLKIIGGYYHLETGKVDFFKNHLETAASSAIQKALD
ncbi:MAG: carbonic anhydrase [Chlamydiales bacterium]|jgi:carbonic anhydrase|nr:carbonic anhydrase [Chlamydiales bacterium]